MSTMEKLEEAFETFTAGSQGFCEHVATHCDGFGLSVGEVARICRVASNSSAFLRVWQDSAWWTDEKNA
jgi:hypothetical protein